MVSGGGSRRVEVYAKSTAVSATPVRPGKTYPLSALDHGMGAHRVSVVFYYAPGPAVDREALKESLAEVLSHYPAMTGRLSRAADQEGTWVVRCNDAGVRLLDARAEATVEEWVAGAAPEEEAQLAQWEEMPADVFLWSPYCIQITEFKDKGVAVGLSCTHLHADPNTAVLFLKAWADTHRRACIVNPLFFSPVALRPRSQPSLSSPSARLLDLKSSAPPSPRRRLMSSATFLFSDHSVKSCLADLAPVVDAAPFDALAALFWVCVRRPAGAGIVADHDALTVCVDFRKSLEAPLPHGFYGNALHFSRVDADLGAGGWAAAAEAVGRHVAGLQEEEYWSAVDWFGSRRGSAPFQMYGPELTCVKLDHVFAYGAALEKDGGRPVHVSCRLGEVEGDGVVVVMPAAEGGLARAVTATLPAEVLAKVCGDEEILRHGTRIIFK